MLLFPFVSRRSSCDDEAAQLRYNNQLRTAAGAWDHLKSMKDVFAVQLTPNSDLQQQHQGSASSSIPTATSGSNSSSNWDQPLWICPVTLLHCGSKQPFSALKACGHVLSDKAIAAVPAADRRCPVCDTPFDQPEVVLINGSSEHMESVRQQIRAKAAAKAAAKAEKAAKQKKRGQLCLESSGDAAVLALPATAGGGDDMQQEKQKVARLQ